MTPKQVLETLYNDMKEKLSDYYKSETLLSEQASGFIDKHYFDEIKVKYQAWQSAHNKFHSYVAVLKEKGLLESIFSI